MHKHSQLNDKGPLVAEFLIFTLNHPQIDSTFSEGRFFDENLTLGRSKKNWEANSKIRLQEDLYNLVFSFCAKFEGCAAKTVGGVGFAR